MEAITEAIIYNSESQGEALQERLHNKLSLKAEELVYNATRYSDIIKHPDDNRVAVIIERTRIPAWWVEIEQELTPAELNNIETIDINEWVPPPPGT